MCGIAGQFFHDSVSPPEDRLQKLGAAMRYRGPDDEGMYTAPHIGLVHRRLSIRDLSAAGHCPMTSADGVVSVIFNGEIYNWRELRAELQAAGYPFVSESDAEVLLHGYRAWGDRVIPRLRGMFAIAIWDVSVNRLLLARDRVGEKPLYYRAGDAGLDFSSSIAAIALLHPDRQIDPDAVACYFSHSFIPATHTVWRGFSVLPPAHMLVISPGQTATITPYWCLPDLRPKRMTLAEAESLIETTVEDSVRRCLDADVPVGVFLSGGVDSSLVAAMASRHKPGLPAFSLGYSEEDFSELPYASAVAQHLGIPHHVIKVGVEDLIECLPHLVAQYGQPFGDASAVPTYLVSRLARQHVKVCLSGDGGDESFGGYWRLQAGVYARRYGMIVPEAIRQRVVPLITPLLGSAGRRWLSMNELSLSRPGAAYTNHESWYSFLELLAGPRAEPGLRHDLVACRTAYGERPVGVTPVQRILFEDFRVQLPDAYLTKVDVASMAASLEVRAPLLDQKVIEAAWSLPDDMKLHWAQRKWLLKRIAARWVPRQGVYRTKMGFALPLVHWWRGDLGAWLETLMRDSVAEREGWIKAEPVRQMLAEHRRGANHHTRLWLVLWMELWFRLVFQSPGGIAIDHQPPSA